MPLQVRPVCCSVSTITLLAWQHFLYITVCFLSASVNSLIFFLLLYIMTCPVTGQETCRCKQRNERALRAAAVAVVLNLLLPFLLKRFATQAEVKPPAGAHKLPFKSQLMHMFVHHAHTPLTSSIIIAVIVGASVYIADLMQ